MTRKHTKRKHWGIGDAVSVAIAGARVIDDTRLGLLRDVEKRALEAFQFGRAEDEHRDAIAAVAHSARALVEMGVGPEVLPSIAAVDAFLDAADLRREKTGRLGATGPDLQAVRDLFEYHDLQRTSVDLSTYQRAVERAINLRRAAHRRGAPEPA